MIKTIILFFAILTTYTAFAQSDAQKSTAEAIQNHYNSDQHEDIFSLFSPEMKEALPEEQLKVFLVSLKWQMGKIENLQFLGIEDQSYVTYKTTFEKATLQMNLSLNDQNEINGLLFKPFVEKTAQNQVVNMLINLSEERADIILNRVQQFPNKTQIALAYIENGESVFYGILKENDTLKSIDLKDAIFEIGSITKVFTSTLLATAVQEKKISLEDNINKYYDFKFNNDINISFKSLANHTSGLERLPSNLDLDNVDMSNPYGDYNEELLHEFLQNSIKLSSDPGTTYNYSNTGSGLLGHTLGLVYQTTYFNLLQDKIFSPLGMTNSFPKFAAVNKSIVNGQNESGAPTANWEFDALAGAGSILSTVSDLSKFVFAHMDQSNETLALTRTPTFNNKKDMQIGLGWHIPKSSSGKDFYWHNGGTGGYTSSLAMDTENKNAIIILSNVSAFHPNTGNIDNLCFDLMTSLEN